MVFYVWFFLIPSVRLRVYVIVCGCYLIYDSVDAIFSNHQLVHYDKVATSRRWSRKKIYPKIYDSAMSMYCVVYIFRYEIFNENAFIWLWIVFYYLVRNYLHTTFVYVSVCVCPSVCVCSFHPSDTQFLSFLVLSSRHRSVKEERKIFFYFSLDSLCVCARVFFHF